MLENTNYFDQLFVFSAIGNKRYNGMNLIADSINPLIESYNKLVIILDVTKKSNYSYYYRKQTTLNYTFFF